MTSGEENETAIDEVILATGFRFRYPFIDDSILPASTDDNNNELSLYKHVFVPTIRHPHSLAFVGALQPFGPFMPISEMQSRYFAMLMSKKLKLPSEADMVKDIAKQKKAMKKQFYDSPRHTVQVFVIPYLDQLAKTISVKPPMFKYFFNDNKLWRHMAFGPSLPYQYRLEGSNAWPGARDALLTAKKRVKAGFKASSQSS